MSWLFGWKRRLPFTIAASKVDATLTHFPVLLLIQASSGIDNTDLTPIFDELGTESLKIAVTDADGTTERYVEVVSWDSVNEVAELWVSRSDYSLSSSVNNVGYIYFDKDHVDNTSYVGVTGSTLAQAVWNSNFKLVSHMNDNPDTSSIKDSTSNGNDGTKKAVNEPIETDGQIGKAQEYDIINDKITVLHDETLDITTESFALECWVNPSDISNYPYLFEKTLWSTYGYALQIYPTGAVWFGTIFNGGYDLTKSYGDISIGSFYHIVAVREGTVGKIYINGVDRTASSDAIADLGSSAARALQIGTSIFSGILDEARFIKGVAPSPAWVGASYETQRDQFINYGAFETEFPGMLMNLAIKERRISLRSVE